MYNILFRIVGTGSFFPIESLHPEMKTLILSLKFPFFHYFIIVLYANNWVKPDSCKLRRAGGHRGEDIMYAS